MIKIDQKKSKANFILLFIVFITIIGSSCLQTFIPLGASDFTQDSPLSDLILKTSANENITILTPINDILTSPDAGYYPGTYGFENETIGSEPAGINKIVNSSCSLDIIEEMAGHKNVVELDDNSSTGRAGFNLLNSEYWAASNTVEFYVRTTDASKLLYFGIYYSTPNQRAIVKIESYKFQHFDGTYHDVGRAAINNTWYHIKIEHTTTNYYLYIDGEQYGPFTYQSAGGVANMYRFGTSDPQKNYTCYIDAIGFGVDGNYEIGDNLNEGLLLSYENTTVLDWQGYSLDGAANVTIQGNTTIPLPDDGQHTIQVFGNDTLGTNYQSDIKYFTVRNDTISIVSPYSTTYSTPDAGHYPATYGFENDIVGTNPSGWNVSEPVGVSIDVISYLDGHENIIELNDQGMSANDASMNDKFSPKTNGTIEFWIRKGVGDNKIGIEFYESATRGFSIWLDRDNNNKFEYYDSKGYHEFAESIYSDNKWFHLKIDFNCVNFTFDCYLNDTLEVDYGLYQNNVSQIDEIKILCAGWDSDAIFYIDAVGYSWDPNYEIGDNLNEGLLLSYENTTVLDWQGHSLDGAANVTIQGNTTIPLPDDGQHFIQLFANNTAGINYQSDIKYFTVKNGTISIITPINDTYSTPDAGYYPGSYGFENDANNQDPSGWTVTEDPNTYCNIISSKYNHNKVIEFWDDDNSGQATMNIDFAPQTTETIELWIAGHSDVDTGEFLIFFRNAASDVLIDVRFVWGPSWQTISARNNMGYQSFGSIADDVWYHLKIEFNSTAGTYNVYVNNILQASNFGYSNGNTGDVTNVFIQSHTTQDYSDFYAWIDAFGFSWDPNYEIGDNMNEGLLLSYENTTALDWQGYSIDGAANVTIQGNTTIPMPTGNGPHSIQVFGNTSTGINYQSDMRYFTLEWEYASLRPTTNYLDMIADLDLYVEISMDNIGFLEVELTSLGYPAFPYFDNAHTSVSFYNFTVFNANFDEDESMISGITLRFYYDPLEVSDPENLRVYHYSSSQGKWISEDVTVNQTGYYVEITITDLSWFCFGEFSFPPVDFPWLLLALIILLSVIGLIIPSSYVVVSKKKKKKKSVIQEKRQNLLEEKLTPHEIETILQREKVLEIKREQVTPIHPIESRVIRKTEPHKKPRKEKIEPEKTPIQLKIEEEEKKREIKETESEMDIKEEVDKCIVHKGQIQGVTYICPKCKARYCLNCAQALVSREEACWLCEKPIKLGVRSIEDEKSVIIKPSDTRSKKKTAQDNFENIKVLNILKQAKIEEKINIGGNLTTVSKKFWESIDLFEWEENEKEQFVKEMLSLSPSERQNIVESMLKKNNEGK